MPNDGVRAWIICTVALILSPGIAGQAGEPTGKPKATAKLLASGDALEWEYDGGIAQKATIPLYRSGNIRYFSAGVGLEEREVIYPPFALKLVLVAGEKPYLSRVDIKVFNAAQQTVLSIPKEQVLGPWIFIDLPPGLYEITANWEGRPLTQRKVTVTEGAGRTVHFRWLMAAER
jgi:hypothetical protein